VLALLRLRDWPLRMKIAAVLAMSSLVPLAAAAYIDLRGSRARLHDQGAALLAARADQLADKLDTFNRGYQLAAAQLAATPAVVALAKAPGDSDRAITASAVLAVHPANDHNLRGVGVLDPSGRVIAATEPTLVGTTIELAYVRTALSGRTISEIHVARSVPTIAYAAPIVDGGRAIAIAVLWTKAEALWAVARASNELAGDGSFAVVFDRVGIRIAHTYSKDITFHPGGKLDAPTIDRLVAEQRFGPRTRQLLQEPRLFPEQFERARSSSLDRKLFEGFAPVNGMWNYGVARRLATIPWTAFYMIPMKSLDAPLTSVTRSKLIFAIVIILVALFAGLMFASPIVRGVRSLTHATTRLAAGDLSARAPTLRGDEIGQLGTSFNAMAARIESQDAILRRRRDDLEQRVTERTNELVVAKAAAEQSEQSLAITLDSIGDGVIATDTERCIVRMNPIAQQLTGWSIDEARGRPLGDVFHIIDESTRVRIPDPAVIVLERRSSAGLASRTALVSRDGTERAIADSGAPIRDSSGTIRGVVLVFRDQTHEREAERQLRASEARTAAVMEAALDAIVVMDHAGHIIDVNPAAQTLLGYSREDAIGRLLSETLIPPASREAHRVGLARYNETGIQKILGKRLELSAMRRDGTEFPAEITIVRIVTEGAPVFTGFIRDITERKRAAEVEVMCRAKEAAELANVELEAFSYSVAHDLRSPLRAINGFSHALVEDYADKLDGDARDYLDRIAAGARRMGELIDGLLALARIAKSEIERRRIDLGALARDLIGHLDPAHKVDWQVEGELIANGDPRLLHSLMENLLGNAWKFSRDHDAAVIEVGMQLLDGEKVYFVKDNGVGFDMAHTRKLFSPFHRLHTEAEFEGTGIGLATVERIVRRHGGRIWAESCVGKGATFYFTLPHTPATREIPQLRQVG